MLETSLCILNDLKEQLDLATSKCGLILKEIDSIKECVGKSSESTISVESNEAKMDCKVVEKGTYEVSGSRENYTELRKVVLTLKNCEWTKCTRFRPKKTKKKDKPKEKSTKSIPKNEVVDFMKRFVDKKENHVSKLIERFNQEANFEPKQAIPPVSTKKFEKNETEKIFAKRQMTNFNTIPFIVGFSTSKSYNIGLSTQEYSSRLPSSKESSSVFETVADFWSKKRREIPSVPRCECLPAKLVNVDEVWNEILNFKNNISPDNQKCTGCKPNNSFYYTKLFRRIQRLQDKYERNKVINY